MNDPHDIIPHRSPDPTEAALAARRRALEPYDPEAEWDDDGSDGAGSTIFEILRRRWLTAVLVTLLMAGLSAAALLHFVKPRYKVSALLHIAPVVRPILFTDSDTDISRQYDMYVNTESEAMVSPAVVSATVDTPEVRSLPAVASAPEPVVWIRSGLEVERVGRTELLEVSMIGDVPDQMAAIVNTLLRTYIRWREDEKRQWDERMLRSLRREEAELKAQLAAKNTELRQLAVDHGLGTASDSGLVVDDWVRELQQMITEANMERARHTAKLESMDKSDSIEILIQSDPTAFQQFLQNDRHWQGLKDRVETLEVAVLDDERLGRGPEHPDVKGRQERLEQARAALATREKELQEQYRRAARHRIEAKLMEAEATVSVLQKELERLTGERASLSRQAFVLEDVRHERQRLEHSLAQVRQKIWNVEVEQNRMARVTIESLAEAPKEPNIDKRLKYGAAAAFMSLCLGLGAALVRDRFDTSVRSPQEITRQLGLPLLGSIQRIRKAGKNGLLQDERVLEPVRGISTVLLTCTQDHQTQRWLITSPTARSGKSSMAINLARSVAATGRRTLLLDADNIAQGVSRSLGLTRQPGLRELLEGTHDRDSVIHETANENLFVVSSGLASPHFGELLARQRARETLRDLFASYDSVIVDSPPVLATSTAVVLATLVDEVVLILRAGQSTRQEAMAARRQLTTVGSKLVGVILNAVDPKEAPYSYYGYTYTVKDNGIEA